MYLQYHIPAEDDRLAGLRDVYLGQVGILMEAADWADHPGVISDCASDPDLDGNMECLLADEQYFACIDMDGGRLTHLFYLSEDGVHQLVAPTVQFALGLSDASQWHPEKGDAADPGAVMGAFGDPGDPFNKYRALSLSAGELVLDRFDGRITKVFRLTDSSMMVTYRIDAPVRTAIPLLADPQAFYFGHTSLQAISRPGLWIWGLSGGSTAEVRSVANLSAVGFNVSRVSLEFPEDPNNFFPVGHYYPFPFSMVSLLAEEDFTVWIKGK
jgi:hypothetical protein